MPWDYFISHASEDKPLVAAPLAHYLRSGGFNVWYDDFSLSVGDSILAGINRGLAESQFGVVIFSPAFFAKPWPQRELAGLVATASGNERRVLPVWHQVSAADVVQASPILADLKAVSTSAGLDAVAFELVRASFPDRLRRLGLKGLSNAKSETREHRAEAQKLLADLLQGTSRREDILLVLSAYHSILAGLVGYAGLVVPASLTNEPVPFDFAIIVPSGFMGPAHLVLVVLGPVTGDDRRLSEFIAELRNAYGPSVGDTEGPPQDPRRPGGPLCPVSEFPCVHGLANQLNELAEWDNGYARTYRIQFEVAWTFSVFLLYGRRTTDPDAWTRRRAIASSSSSPIYPMYPGISAGCTRGPRDRSVPCRARPTPRRLCGLHIAQPRHDREG